MNKYNILNFLNLYRVFHNVRAKACMRVESGKRNRKVLNYFTIFKIIIKILI